MWMMGPGCSSPAHSDPCWDGPTSSYSPVLPFHCAGDLSRALVSGGFSVLLAHLLRPINSEPLGKPARSSSPSPSLGPSHPTDSTCGFPHGSPSLPCGPPMHLNNIAKLFSLHICLSSPQLDWHPWRAGAGCLRGTAPSPGLHSVGSCDKHHPPPICPPPARVCARARAHTHTHTHTHSDWPAGRPASQGQRGICCGDSEIPPAPPPAVASLSSHVGGGLCAQDTKPRNHQLRV